MASICAPDRNFAEFSGSLDRLQCAERHFVVVRSDTVNLLAGCQPVLHNGLALYALPVTGLFTGDFDVGEFLLNDFFDSIRPAKSSFIAQFAHQDDQLSLAS